MANEIVFLPLATEDIRKAQDWYEEQKTGLGKEFLQAVLKQAEQLKDDFRDYRFFVYPVRYTKMNKFPYSIFFIKEEDDLKKKIVITAVLGNKQNMLNIIRERF